MEIDTAQARSRLARVVDVVWTMAALGCGVALLWGALAQLSRPVGIEPAITIAQSRAVATMQLRRAPLPQRRGAARTARPTAAPVIPLLRMHLTTGIASGGHIAAAGHTVRHQVRVASADGRVTSGAPRPVAVAAHPVAVRSSPRSAPGGRPQRQRPPAQRSKRPRRAYVATAVVPLEPPRWFDPTPELARATLADPPLASSGLGGIRVRGRELVVPASPAPVARP